MFDLCVHSVQFHRTALEMGEWDLLQPLVKRGSPAHKSTSVKMHVLRKPGPVLIDAEPLTALDCRLPANYA
jgi:hypothetical protein